MGRTKDIYQDLQEQIALQAERVDNGHASYVDGLIFMRDNRAKIEDTLELIKDWEKANFNEISLEAEGYKDGYKGLMFEVRGGRKNFIYKSIPEVTDAEIALKMAKEKYKSFFIAKEKGSAFANIDENGEELPLPEISYGSGSIVIKQMKR